jgi:hypothetical protein
MGGSLGRCGRVQKISPSPEFDPRTVQPVALLILGLKFEIMTYFLFVLSHSTKKIVPMHTRKTCRGSRGMVVLILNLGTRWRRVVSFTFRPFYPSGKEPMGLIE